MSPKPTPSFTATVRFEYPNVVGMLGKVTSAIGEAGGDIGSIDIVKSTKETITRDINLSAFSVDHIRQLIREIKKIPGINIIHVTDRTFAIHHGGKIEIKLKHPVNNREDLSMVYTPGVARVCVDIHQHPKHIYNYTIKANSVALVSDGSAAADLGNVGPGAVLPLLEGKAMLFKNFAGINAYPLGVATNDPGEIAGIIKNISPGFGGIDLVGISSPRCFEIQEQLDGQIDVPVFHDESQGTAVVVLAALFNALKVVEKKLDEIKIVISGAGTAGIGCARLLIAAGANPRRMVICDRQGSLHRGNRGSLNRFQQELAAVTNPVQLEGGLREALAGADFFLGLSAPNILGRKDINQMAAEAIVFVLARPTPEIMPEEINGYAQVVATGRSDYPNQLSDILCFPGLFRGLLNARLKEVNDEIMLTAARALAGVIKQSELNEDYIIPSPFDARVPQAIARAVENMILRKKITHND